MTGPRFNTDWHDLAAVARDMLARRVADYPAAVAANKRTQAQADEGIRLMALVVAQWQWVTGQPGANDPDPGYADCFAMRLTLDQAVARARAKADRAIAKFGTDSREGGHEADYADCVAALAWHQQPLSPDFSTPRVVFLRRATLFAQRTFGGLERRNAA